jgi:sugar transferase (PEP-CTERM/EpsH1 system associated)
MSRRILFLTPQLPYPPQQGTAIRNYNLIAQVAQRHEVHLLSFVDPSHPTTDLGPLREWCASVRSIPAPLRSTLQRLRTVATSRLPDIAHRLSSTAFRQALGATLQGIPMDVLQVEGLEMAPHGLWSQTLPGAPRLVFDAHNAEFLLQQRIFQADVCQPPRWLGALYSLIQWQRLRRYEALVCRRAERVIACSPADADALARLVPGLHAAVVPNGVDPQSYRAGGVTPASLGKQALVFTGKMDFRPNVDAILWFCAQVLPRIRQTAPQAHLYVVGKNPHPRLACLATQPGVTLTGYVEDVRPYIAAAEVYVVPLLTGGGTRLKVLEAMAMGKALVSTTLGCEGIPAVSGRDLVVADSAADLATQVLALLGNAARREQLGRAARAFVEQHFDWQTVTAPLEEVYER